MHVRGFPDLHKAHCLLDNWFQMLPRAARAVLTCFSIRLAFLLAVVITPRSHLIEMVLLWDCEDLVFSSVTM